MKKYYAHSKQNEPPENWQPLEEHLSNTAELAAEFARPFGAEEYAHIAGLWHDVGKMSNVFQQYLQETSDAEPSEAESMTSADHSTAGAQYIKEQMGMLGLLLAYVVAGHHGGLPNGIAANKSLHKRLQKRVQPWRHGLKSVPNSDVDYFAPCELLQNAINNRDPFAFSFFTRMLFSALTDADFLDTEAFLSPDRYDVRPRFPDNVLGLIEEALDARINAFGMPETHVDRKRAEVRRACIEAASRPPGVFSLTVPTGGGKTLASLAFALRHAQEHNLNRIVYVIPFTTIIEQTADVFRKAVASVNPELAGAAIIEHHSNFDPDQETLEARLATENWDAPLIITTSVQFYESLYGNRASQCRKLHNLANSVVILDEAQTLPVDLLEPCLVGLRELSDNYASTVVLCTATQPAITKRQGFEIGLENVREIIPGPDRLYKELKRTHVSNIGQQTNCQLTKRLQEQRQALCIVNTRRHAAEVYERLGESESDFHLSARMCPAHRQNVFDRIQTRIEEGLPCRVVSTQLIEAGVDIDFPVVFRSMAGVDSIAQAAGRCNRHGTIKEGGRLFLFRAEDTSAEKFFADTANCGRQILELYDDPLDLDAVEHYFRLYYWDQSSRWDARNVLDCFELDKGSRNFPFLFDFAEAAQRFQLIDNHQKTVLIPWGEQGAKLCSDLRYVDMPSRDLLRRLQRYAVQIPTHVWEQHVGRELELLHERFAVLVSPELHYSEATGLNLDVEGPIYLEA